MKFKQLIQIITVLMIFMVEIFGFGMDGGFSNLRGIRPYALGKGTLGLSLYQEYSDADLTPTYDGEYCLTTRGALGYGLFNNLDLKFLFPYYIDVVDMYKYGAGDISLGLKYVPSFLKLSSWFNSFQVLISLPTGFKENPLVSTKEFLRPFSAKKTAFFLSYQTEFQYSHFYFTVNLGYYNLPYTYTAGTTNPAGRMYHGQTLHHIGEGYMGLDTLRVNGTSCPQFPFTVSINYKLFKRLSLYLEYSGAILRSNIAAVNDPVSITPGIEIGLTKKLSVNFAVDYDLFETLPKRNFILGFNFYKDLLSVPTIIEEYPISPETIRRIAIVEFDDYPRKGFGNHLRSNLREKILYSKDFILVENYILDNAIQENKISREDLHTKASLVSIGRTLNLDYIISVKVLDEGYYMKKLFGIPFVAGGKAFAYKNKILLTIISPENAEYVYNNTFEVLSYKPSGFYLYDVDPSVPGNFFNIDTKRKLFKRNSDQGVQEILKVFYTKFYNFKQEKLTEHMKNKGYFEYE